MDLRRDASRKEIDVAVNGMALGPVNTLLTKLIFRHLLLKRAYAPDGFRQMAGQTPFKTCGIEYDGIGMEVSLHK